MALLVKVACSKIFGKLIFVKLADIVTFPTNNHPRLKNCVFVYTNISLRLIHLGICICLNLLVPSTELDRGEPELPIPPRIMAPSAMEQKLGRVGSLPNSARKLTE